MRSFKLAPMGLVAFLSLMSLTMGQDTFSFAEEKKDLPVVITEKIGDADPIPVKFTWVEVKTPVLVVKDAKIVLPTNWTIISNAETDGITLDKKYPTYFKWSDAVDGRFFVTGDKGLAYLGTTYGADKCAYQVFESSGSPAGMQFIKLPGCTVYTSLGSYTVGNTDNLTIFNLPKGLVIVRVPEAFSGWRK